MGDGQRAAEVLGGAPARPGELQPFQGDGVVVDRNDAGHPGRVRTGRGQPAQPGRLDGVEVGVVPGRALGEGGDAFIAKATPVTTSSVPRTIEVPECAVSASAGGSLDTSTTGNCWGSMSAGMLKRPESPTR